LSRLPISAPSSRTLRLFGINQADIANQLNIDEKTLRKHFREELNSGKFKVDMLAGRTVTELMKPGEERVRLDAANDFCHPVATSAQPLGRTRHE
jgi:hypothetical protein